MKNHNKTALVIGGKGGIGEAAVRRLSKDGFNVYATYFNKPLKQKIENINYIKCDKCSGKILHKIRTTNKCQYNCR